MPQLSGDLIRHKLPTYVFGQNVVYTERIGSTNTELKRLAGLNAPEGLLYITDEQLVGRGRQDRRWYAPPESSLLMSLLFRPGAIVAPNQAQRLTMLCAVALLEAVSYVAGIAPQLKWPNDLLWSDGKKMAGILTELESEGDRLTWVVVGTGLNVNLDFTKHETYQKGNGNPPLSQTATSISTILGRDCSDLRLPILQRYLFNVEQRYNALQAGELPHNEWLQHLRGLNEPITVLQVDGARLVGVMAGVDEDGALLLRDETGAISRVLAGDVSFR